MASPYAQSRGGGGGSPYAVNRGAGGGSPYSKPRSAGGGGPVASSSGGGGILGAIEGAAHTVAQKAELTARDIKGIPGGIYQLGAADVHTLTHKPTAAQYANNMRQWSDLVHFHLGRLLKEGQAPDATPGSKVGGGFVQSSVHAIKHPGADPFATALTVLPLASGALRAGEIGAGVDISAPRVLRSGEGQTSLIRSKSALGRTVQAGYDTVVQGGLDRNPAGRIAGHGMKRIGGANAEEARLAARMNAAPAGLLDRSAAKLLRGRGTRRAEQAALELTSNQTTPQEAAAYHLNQAEQGVNPGRSRAVAKLYQNVAARDLVHLDETRPPGEKVFINPAHERLAAVDAHLARVQAAGDEILAAKGVRTPEQLQARADAPGRIRAGGAEYEKPTPGKLGQPSQALTRMRGYVNRLEAEHARAQAVVQRFKFTAADAKRVGQLSPGERATSVGGAGQNVMASYPTNESVNLRAQLRPLEKELRAQTEAWNAPAKQGGGVTRMTDEEAKSRLAYLDAQHEARLEKLKPEVNPYATGRQGPYLASGARESEAGTIAGETRSRNTARGRLAKGMQPYVRGPAQEGRIGGGPVRIQTVQQELRDLAEAKLHQTIADNPDHPVSQALAQTLAERDQLRNTLNSRVEAQISGERPPELPATGEAGPSIYEQRSGLNRVVRAGTVAQHALGQFTEAAGAASEAVPGLDELHGRVEELTNAINEARGFPPEDLLALRKQVAEVRKALRDAETPRSYRVGDRALTPFGEFVKPIGAIRAERASAALSVARDRLQQMEEAAGRRMKPTGIVGGEAVRPGRGFVSERVSQKRLSSAEAAASRGPVVGEAQPPVNAQPYTGRALAHGLRPKNVSAGASQHFRQILRFQTTDNIRRNALRFGSDVRRSQRDILVRDPDVAAKPIGQEVKEALGRETSTVDTPHDLATEAGLAAAHEAFRDSIFYPGELASRFTGAKDTQIGVKAPEGYKWVDRNALGDISRSPQGPRGRIARSVDNVNSAITAATVYFKVGHVGTRYLTDAATNIIQGSARPHEIAKSLRLWHSLSDEEKARALAAAGQHGFSALPHEGTNLVSRIAGRGANFWAQHADAMFRFNSLAHELRRIGVDNPEKFKNALDALQTRGEGLPSDTWARLSSAARKSDREAMSYDRLDDFEKKFLTRAIWFYPWVKASTLFTVRSMIEHPVKAAVLGAAGVTGRQTQLRQLGETPSYEAGLVALTSGARPLTTDFSTFSPYSTAADVTTAFTQPGALAGQFNPVVSAAGQLAYGLNRFGAPSKTPYLDALLALGSATPEQQLAETLTQGGDQSRRMFRKTPGSTFERFLVGPATPRRVNRAALVQAAARERSGRR